MNGLDADCWRGTCRAHARLCTHPLPSSGSHCRLCPAAHRQIESHRLVEPHARTSHIPRKRSLSKGTPDLGLRRNDIMIECDFPLTNCGI